MTAQALSLAAVRKQRLRHEASCKRSRRTLLGEERIGGKSAAETGVSVTETTNNLITAWLTQNAMPVEVVPGGDTHDLQPLKKILRSAKIVGLAEATPGTKEFFQIRH